MNYVKVASYCKSNWRLPLAVIVSFGLATAAAAFEESTKPYDLWIRNGLIHDGAGGVPVQADVLVRGDRIVQVGSVENVTAKRTIDATGMIVAPGFIDTHAHGDPLEDESFANFALQGVTSVVLGQDGRTPGFSSKSLSAATPPSRRSSPLPAWMAAVEKVDLQTNIATLVGHGSLRRTAGVDVSPEPTAGQMASMQRLLREGLNSGAYGMSSGLEYVPGRYARRDELVALSGIVGSAGGVIMSHLRSEDSDKIVAALEELIAQAGPARVHASHLKIVFAETAEEGDRLVDFLDTTRDRGVAITADVYPWLAGFADLSLLYPPWAKTREEWENAVANDRPRLETYLRKRIGRRGGASAVLFASAPYINKTLEQVAEETGLPPEDVVIDVMGFGGPNVAHFIMRKDVQDRIIAWEYAAVSTDGGPWVRHPRSWGTYPKILEEYVRERGLLSMEEAVRKMSGLPAKIVGLPDRGRIEEDAYADIVIFSPDTVSNRATWPEPAQPPAGIGFVIVNGCVQVEEGRLTSHGCGRLLRKSDQDTFR